MLSTLVAAARAKSAAYVCFINDDDNELEIDDDDDIDDDNDDDFMLENWFGLVPPPAAAPIINNNHILPALPRFTRAKGPPMKHYESRHVVDEIRGTRRQGRPDGSPHW